MIDRHDRGASLTIHPNKGMMVAAALIIATMLLVAVFALAGGSASPARLAAGAQEVDTSGVKLWQEKEAPAYVPVRRDMDQWRSVRMPPASIVEEMLRDRGAIPLNATAEEIEALISSWYEGARKDAYTGPDPLAYRNLMAREEALLDGSNALAPEEVMYPTPQKSLLGVVVEFAPPSGSEMITRTYPVDPDDPSMGCTVITDTFTTLSVGDDPPPGPRDNFAFYDADGFTVDDYRSAFFDTGPDAGYGVVRDDLGGIDLSGYSLNNYLLEMSRGVYTATGDVLTMPVTVPHSHEYYGYAQYSEDAMGNCTSPTFSDANYFLYVPDVIDAIIAQYGDSIDWSEFDADGDQVIDLLVTIHAGYGFQNGGGEDRLSTSSSQFFAPDITSLPQIGGTSTPGDPSDDYYVRGFNVDPEQLDVGAIQEEFEHQFGLPDLYSTDGSNSNAWWGAHSSGVWGGPLGATRPVGHNLWQDWVLGWRDPMIIDYNDPQLLMDGLEVTIGRARYTPEGTSDGVIIRLPDEETIVQNLAGSGVGWWSTSGDLLDHRVYRDFDLTTATGPVTFSLAAYWDIETDWDYGFFEVSTDGGSTWTTQPDIDGVLTDTDPNGNNLGWGLTDSGSGTLRFDLSAYTGMTIGVRLRYLTDVAVANPGWWVDDLLLEDDTGVLYENDLETDFSDWTNEGWAVVPITEIDERYYIIEWRDDNGFDQSLNDPYYPVYSNPVEPPPEFEVDRVPATTPGMTVSYRNTGQGFDYAIFDDLDSGISTGPKHGLIVVDSHFEAVRFDTTFMSFQDGWVGYTMYGRTKSGNAAFGHEPTNEWTARLGLDVDAGEYVTVPLETKTWPSEPGVPAFHDSFGYYPGYYYPGSGPFVYYHDSDSSAAIPAKAPYSTRITDLSGNLMPALFGIPIGPGPGLGTGNPGDDLVQYGLHVEVLDQSEEEATVRVWNSIFEVEASATTDLDFMIGNTGTVTLTVDQNIGGQIVEPFILVKVPDNISYTVGTAFGGMTPIEDGAFASPEAVAAYVSANGLESLAPAGNGSDVEYLAWSGDDIWTKMGTAPFGFGATLTGPGDPALQVWYFKNGTELFQSEILAAELDSFDIFVPLIR